MLQIRTAFKNIINGGKQTWLNAAVLSLVIVIMLAFSGLFDGWMDQMRTDTIEWETGRAQLWHSEYDRYDPFTLQDAHHVIPQEIKEEISNNTAVPILMQQAVLYPQGRMLNVLIKGILPDQKVLKIPSAKLSTKNDTSVVYAMIGAKMAKSANLSEGDRVMLQWRDKNGTFDAREIIISHIFHTKAGGVDAGQIWIDMKDLYQMTGMNGEATYVVFSKEKKSQNDEAGWRYKDLDFLLRDINLMAQMGNIESTVIFIILLAIAMLAVYDTQILSIFRRQKEIGTYVALGMTPRQVVALFTIEGTYYSILAIALAAIWGTPVLWWFAKTGMAMPESFGDLGLAIGEAIYPVYHISTILGIVTTVIVFSAFTSFLPARKIGHQNIVHALKGKTT